jgi:hypothetical protein
MDWFLCGEFNMKTEVISHLERKMVGSRGIEPLAVTTPSFAATDLQSAKGKGARKPQSF